MRCFRRCQLSWHITLPNIYEGVLDASVNICCKLKLLFLEKRLSFRVDSGCLYNRLLSKTQKLLSFTQPKMRV